MNTRCFTRFSADIEVFLHVPFLEHKVHSSAEFIAPFCLKSLHQVLSSLYPWFPHKWVDFKIDFRILEPSVVPGPYNPLVCHNYYAIAQLIMREILYAIDFELLITKYGKEF